MGVEALGWALLAQLFWLGLAIAGALSLPGRVGFHLGLVRSRLRIGPVVALAFGFLCASIALDLVLRSVELREVGQLGGLDRWIRETDDVLGLLLALVVLPALGEELLFRGLVQRFLQERFDARVAVALAAAAFGVAHGDPVHATAAFGLGLYLGAIALLSGSVWPAVLAHACNNALAVASVWLGITGPPGGLLAASAWALAALAVLGEVARRQQRKSSIPEGNALQDGH